MHLKFQFKKFSPKINFWNEMLFPWHQNKGYVFQQFRKIILFKNNQGAFH